MKLYYSPGACSLAAHIALRMTGAEFEIEKVDTRTKMTASGADYTRISAKGYVPALQLPSGDVLTEAPAVLQYIADRNPAAALAPESATLERARLQEHLNFVSSELHKAFKPFFAGTPIADNARPAAEDVIAKRMVHIEALLTDGRMHLVGNTVSVADLYLFVVANWCNFIGIDLGQWPNVAAFVERMAALPAVREAMTAEGLIH